MTALLERLLSVPPIWVYVVVTALVLVADALFVGFLVPAETAVVLGGVAAEPAPVSWPAASRRSTAAASTQRGTPSPGAVDPPSCWPG